MTSTVQFKQIDSLLTAKDFLGTIRVRMNMYRMNYKVEPGLYRIGNAE